MINNKKIYKTSWFLVSIIVVLIIFGIGVIYAAQFYQSNPGTNITVDEWGVCKEVNNAGSNSYFIPTNSDTEWTAFRTAADAGSLPGITLADCVSTCVAGDYYNWDGMTCNEFCGNMGGTVAGVGLARVCAQSPADCNNTYNIFSTAAMYHDAPRCFIWFGGACIPAPNFITATLTMCRCDCPVVILNSQTGSTCNTICSNNGGLSCVSVGTDVDGIDGHMWSEVCTIGCACIQGVASGCDQIMSLGIPPFGGPGPCAGHGTQWTNCRCQ